MKILSIVVPSYNVEKYLNETIESILNCNRKLNIDLIIVNDGSTDKTMQIANKYQRQYPTIITVVNKENGGHGSTINYGLKVAKGKYFIVIDGDDWVDNAILDEFISFIENQDSDVVVTGHYRNYITTGIEDKYTYKEEEGLKTDLKYLVDNNYRIPMTDICYKTNILRNVHLNIQEHTFYVDEEFCSFPFVKIETIQFFSRGFYHYRIGDVNQSVSDINMVKKIDHKKRVFYRIMNEIQDNDIYKINYEYIRGKMVGMANSILLVYYIYFPNKLEGRKKGKDFLEELLKRYPDVAKDCIKIGKVFRMMNFLHISPKVWKNYQTIKQWISERVI